MFQFPTPLPLPLHVLTVFQFNCGHFKRCNEWLADRYGPDGIIDWSLSTKSLAANATPPTKNNQSTVTRQKLAIPRQDASVDEFEGDDADVLEALATVENLQKGASSERPNQDGS